MAKLTKKGALEVTGTLDRLATLLHEERDTLGIPERVAADFIHKCDLLGDHIERKAGIDPVTKNALDGDDPVKEPGFDPEQIGEEKAGPKEDEPDESYMDGHFSQQENRELRDKVEDGGLEDQEREKPTPGKQAAEDHLAEALNLLTPHVASMNEMLALVTKLAKKGDDDEVEGEESEGEAEDVAAGKKASDHGFKLDA
jgi:hypothetical protein